MTSTFEIVIHHGAGTLTLDDETNAHRVMGRSFEHFENRPRKFTFKIQNDQSDPANTDNILHYSFNGWSSGTGAMAIGDVVTYDLAATSFSTGALGSKSEDFYGFITDIQLGPDNAITVIAHDYLERLENIYSHKTFYSAIQDGTHYNTTTFSTAGPDYGKLAIGPVSSSGHYPGLTAEYLCEDTIFFFGNGDGKDATGDNDVTLDASGEKFAQSFIAEFGGTYAHGYLYSIGSSAQSTEITVSIEEDNGSNEPTGSPLFSLSEDYTRAPVSQVWTVNEWGDSGGQYIVRELVPGRKYWMVVELTTKGDVNLVLRRDSAGGYYGGHTSAKCYHYYDGA